MKEVTFSKKEEWQEHDCLYCEKQATLQANAKSNGYSIAIRCCNNESCKSMAKEATESIMNVIKKIKA